MEEKMNVACDEAFHSQHKLDILTRKLEDCQKELASMREASAVEEASRGSDDKGEGETDQKQSAETEAAMAEMRSELERHRSEIADLRNILEEKEHSHQATVDMLQSRLEEIQQVELAYCNFQLIFPPSFCECWYVGIPQILQRITRERLTSYTSNLAHWWIAIKDWMSFFWVHGATNRSADKQIAWSEKRFSDDLFVLHSDSSPMNQKKDIHFLYLQCSNSFPHEPRKKTFIPYVYNASN